MNKNRRSAYKAKNAHSGGERKWPVADGGVEKELESKEKNKKITANPNEKKSNRNLWALKNFSTINP